MNPFLASRIKADLKAGLPTFGSWLSMAHESIAEILAGAGFDWVVVDTEHTAIDVSEVLRLIIAIEGRGSVPMVRVAGNDPIQIKAVLDSGAAGILVPMVNSAEEARSAVQAAKYPPLGRRGACLARAQRYGPGFDQYVSRANDDGFLMVQIEHVDAVENIDEIVTVEGIDGTFIGPYDLSLSLGLPGQLQHPRVLECMQRVLEATLAAGLAPGIHLVHPGAGGERIPGVLESGYRFVALGTDILLLGDSARSIAKTASSLVVKTERGPAE